MRSIEVVSCDGAISSLPLTPLPLLQQVEETCDRLVDASIALHSLVLSKFLPSAVKFTYNWNMRELTNVFQVRIHTHIYSLRDSMTRERRSDSDVAGALHENQRGTAGCPLCPFCPLTPSLSSLCDGCAGPDAVSVGVLPAARVPPTTLGARVRASLPGTIDILDPYCSIPSHIDQEVRRSFENAKRSQAVCELVYWEGSTC